MECGLQRDGQTSRSTRSTGSQGSARFSRFCREPETNSNPQNPVEPRSDPAEPAEPCRTRLYLDDDLECQSIDLDRARDVERARVECPRHCCGRLGRKFRQRGLVRYRCRKVSRPGRQLRRDPRDGPRASRLRPDLAPAAVESSAARHIDPIRLRHSSGRREEGGWRGRGRAGWRTVPSVAPRTHAPLRASNVRPPDRHSARPAASPRALPHRRDAAGRARSLR